MNFTTNNAGPIYTLGCALTCYLQITKEEGEAVLGPSRGEEGDYRKFFGQPGDMDYVQSLYGWAIAFEDHLVCTIYEMDRDALLHVGSRFGVDYPELIGRLDMLFPGRVVKFEDGQYKRYRLYTPAEAKVSYGGAKIS